MADLIERAKLGAFEEWHARGSTLRIARCGAAFATSFARCLDFLAIKGHLSGASVSRDRAKRAG
jgi:hypothetical protein